MGRPCSGDGRAEGRYSAGDITRPVRVQPGRGGDRGTMTGISRRAFNRLAATTLAGAALAASGRGAAASLRGARVVVIGGGFGGATAARSLRRLDGGLDVVLVEPKATYHTCPSSNLVIAGLRGMGAIGHTYDRLAQKHGVRVVRETAVAVDPTRRTVRLGNGETLGYDRLVMAPGIGFRWGAVPGYDRAASRRIPHAWNAGPQTALLRRQLAAMEDGGVVIISPPAGLYRCPPAPYERASLIAHRLKQTKPRSKILILDPKESFSQQALFVDGWQKLYPGMIEWVPLSGDGRVVRVDSKGMVLETEFGERHKGDVINFIPAQKAGPLAAMTGLADASGWCPVDPVTLESTIHENIHVIGDSALISPMAKSMSAAHDQGVIVAAAVRDLLAGRAPAPPTHVTLCYDLIAPDYGISLGYAYRVRNGAMVPVEGARRRSPVRAPPSLRQREAALAKEWYSTITADVFG